MITGYLAPIGLEESLRKELKNLVAQYGRLLICEGPPQDVCWVQNIWYDIKKLFFTSISDAAKQLKGMQALWAHYPYAEVRKGELIASKLPFFSPKPLSFPSLLPVAPLGSWTLLDANTMLASSFCSSPFAHGAPQFQETKIPPSRAYLKLWEFFTLTQMRPKPKQRCLELGASPGSWTWALHQLRAQVIAVDRAELAPQVAKLPGVQFCKKDAFSLTVDEIRDLDWLFCDVICYPEKLFSWIQPWLKKNIHLVCTLKFQGNSDYSILQEFKKIESSRLFHLSQNKHELTWCKLVQ